MVSFTELAPWIWCTARLEGIDEVIVWKKSTKSSFGRKALPGELKQPACQPYHQYSKPLPERLFCNRHPDLEAIMEIPLILVFICIFKLFKVDSVFDKFDQIAFWYSDIGRASQPSKTSEFEAQRCGPLMSKSGTPKALAGRNNDINSIINIL